MTPEALLEKMLTLRGFSEPGFRDEFLNPRYDRMYDPYLMHDMDKAVERIMTAVEKSEMICIYSDYDADGIPGAVILHDFFKKINYEHFWNYIPHRHTEGYGLHLDALQKIKDRGTGLLITVDLGITAVNEVLFARELGMDVIITDHHEPLEIIPDALAVVNPKLGNYPDRMLCGAGVAFKLVQALLLAPAKALSSSPAELASLRQASAASERRFAGAVSSGWEKWLLDMAGIATLSDMVPLVNENRIFAYYGMKVLQKTPRPGLVALFQKSGINLYHLTETDIVFSITPKLNAASRMAHPDDAFKLLASQNRAEGLTAAEHLTALNDQRKKIVATIMRDVHKKLITRKQIQDLPEILVIGDPTWPAGILGLVASKIIEEYSCTTFVWGSEGDAIKGSCRGVGDVSVVKLMQGIAHLLVQFGGHEEAGGFTTTREHVHFLEEAFNTIYQETKHDVSKQIHEIVFDSELELADVTMAHYRALRQMAPFGMGNPKPVFAFKNIPIEQVNQFGKTKEHLELVLSPKVRAISWYARPDSFTAPIEVGKNMTILAEFDHSVFRGKEELRLMIVDVLE
jgi:single-stranded-DNA-specific exonuclease